MEALVSKAPLVQPDQSDRPGIIGGENPDTYAEEYSDDDELPMENVADFINKSDFHLDDEDSSEIPPLESTISVGILPDDKMVQQSEDWRAAPITRLEEERAENVRRGEEMERRRANGEADRLPNVRETFKERGDDGKVLNKHRRDFDPNE